MTEKEIKLKYGKPCEVCNKEMPFCDCSCKAEDAHHYQCHPDNTCNFHACIRGKCRCGKWWIFSEEKNIKLLESVSDMVHWLWADWMKYMVNKLETENEKGENYFWGIWENAMVRWKRQMLQSYYELSEEEKELDRVLARQIIQNWTYDPFTGEKL